MDVLNLLNKLDINYKSLEHNAVYTSLEAQFIKDNIDGLGVKNLFLRIVRVIFMFCCYLMISVLI